MDELEARIRDEVFRIKPIVEDITGLTSRWNGVVELVPDADFKGKKPFSCTILMDAALAGEEARWRTTIHELLHSVSAGYVQSAYLTFPGWEEGVVEQLQRLHRAEILAQIGVEVPESVFLEVERHHLFNRHIEALEQIRQSLQLPETPFYLDLLRIPIRERPGYVLGLANNLTTEQRIDFVKVYSLAGSVLRRNSWH